MSLLTRWFIGKHNVNIQNLVCLVCVTKKKNTSYQFSVCDRQDGESIFWPHRAAQVLAVTVGWKR